MLLHQPWNSKGNYNYNAYIYTDTDWAPHFHKNFELIYILEGSLTLTVNKRSESMHSGDCALILSNQIHSFEPSPSAKFWVAVFSEQFVPHFAKQIEQYVGEHSVFHCDESVDRLLREKLIFSESSVTMKKACFYAVCDQYAQQVPLCERNAQNEELICQILEYVSTHYREDLSLSDVAEVFGYEYHYLSRILNQGYHINFASLVNEYRVDHAIRLLEQTDKSITDIAMESGFRSIRNFNYVFRAVTGTTPRKYEKKQES